LRADAIDSFFDSEVAETGERQAEKQIDAA
jgi:hypothetical protein